MPFVWYLGLCRKLVGRKPLEESMEEETKAERIKVTASQVATINIKILVF